MGVRDDIAGGVNQKLTSAKSGEKTDVNEIGSDTQSVNKNGGDNIKTTINQEEKETKVSEIEQSGTTPQEDNIPPVDPKKDIDAVTGTIKDPQPPTDWGHFDDDKFKIQDGDIIEYLMKEVILEGSAWCLNKVSGIVGVAAYEITRGFYHEAIKYPWNTWVAPALNDTFNWAWNSISGKRAKAAAAAVPPQAAQASASAANVPSGSYHNGSDDSNAAANNYNLLTQSYRQQCEKLNKLRGLKIDDPKIAAQKDAIQRINSGIAEGLIIYDEEKGTLVDAINDTPWSSCKISKEVFEQTKKATSVELTTLMYNSLTDEEKTKYTPEDMAGILKKLQDYNLAFYRHKEGKGDKPRKPRFPAFSRDIQDIYSEAIQARKAQYAKNKLTTMIEKVGLDAQLYAEHYAQYMLSEKYRKNPKGFDSVKNMEKREKEYEKYLLEGKSNFLRIESARCKRAKDIRDGKRVDNIELPSSAKLIETIQKMADTSSKLAEAKNTTDNVEDNLTPLIVPYKKESPKKMSDYAIQANDFISSREQDIAAYEREQAGLEARQGEIANERKKLEQLKNELGLKSSRTTGKKSSEKSNNSKPGTQIFNKKEGAVY